MLLFCSGSESAPEIRNTEPLRSAVRVEMHERLDLGCDGVICIIRIEEIRPQFGLQFTFVRKIPGSLCK
jgi:hypothetical protein